jgi:hypothetical protein
MSASPSHYLASECVTSQGPAHCLTCASSHRDRRSLLLTPPTSPLLLCVLLAGDAGLLPAPAAGPEDWLGSNVAMLAASRTCSMRQGRCSRLAACKTEAMQGHRVRGKYKLWLFASGSGGSRRTPCVESVDVLSFLTVGFEMATAFTVPSVAPQKVKLRGMQRQW